MIKQTRYSLRRVEKGTDRPGVSECVRGPLPRSVWGLQSFCSPPTPDLQPPDSTPVPNPHFLSIQPPHPLHWLLLLLRSSSNQQFTSNAVLYTLSCFAVSFYVCLLVLLVHMVCINLGCSLWGWLPFCPEESSAQLGHEALALLCSLAQ